jgi:hypothetical protein
MKCFSHRDVDAIGSCKYCCKGLCSRCFAENASGLLSCRGVCEEKVISLDSPSPRRGNTKPPIEKPKSAPAPTMPPAMSAPLAPSMSSPMSPAMSAPMPSSMAAPMPPRMNQPIAPMPGGGGRAPLPPRPEMNRPMAPTYAPPEPVAPSRSTLYLLFQGERYPIDKDEFVIGRSSRNSDLVISNNDISRRHALIVFDGGKYYIQDNESVNGIEYNGQRIKQQQINEGDVYWLASYELRFTFRP